MRKRNLALAVSAVLATTMGAGVHTAQPATAAAGCTDT
jgi:hypothetical protein